jgi:cytochrome b pre-mRNA-processing protein 3
MLFGLFGKSANQRIVDNLHGEIVAAVRQPALYSELGVADTFDGRFELLALFSSLVVRRLITLKAPGPDLAQELTDRLFTRLDDDLREMGVGDLAVPKRIKKLAAALLGRRKAYDTALFESDDAQLAASISLNVHGERIGVDDPQVKRLARYVRAADAALASSLEEALLRGVAPFPAIETIV